MNQPKMTQRTEQQLGIIAISIIVIFSASFFVLKPKIAELKELNAKYAANKESINLYKEKIDKLNDMKVWIQNHQAEMTKLSLALPTDKGVAELLTQMQTITQENFLVINSFTPSSAKTGTAPKKTTQTEVETTKDASKTTPSTTTTPSSKTSVTGVEKLEVSTTFIAPNYATIIDYLKRVENNIRPISITSLSIAGSKTKADEGLVGLSVMLRIETYYQKSTSK